jgi:hypothetical protein
MVQRQTDAVLDRIFHEDAPNQIGSGKSRKEIRAVLAILLDMDDLHVASIIRQTYEDALAGLSPRK